VSVSTIVHGFLTRTDRENHFRYHQDEFDPPFSSAEEYETAGIAFLTAPLAGAIMEGVRRNGDIIRYNPKTQEFAICDRDGILLTYYKPDPRTHRQRNNLTHFRGQCIK